MDTPRDTSALPGRAPLPTNVWKVIGRSLVCSLVATVVASGLALVTAVSVPATATVDSSTLAPAAATEPSLSPTTYSKQAFRTTNRVRVDREKLRTRANGCLQRFANRQARSLAADDPDHLDPKDHQPLGPILKKCELNLVGENLALGFENGRAAVKAGWMKSPSHRANVLERRYRLMALASRQTESGHWVAVQLFGRKA